MKKVFIFINKYNKKYKAQWSLYLFICLFTSIISLLQPVLNGKFIDFLVSEKNQEKIIIFVIIFMSLTIFNILIGYINGRLSIFLNSNISYDIYTSMVSHIHSSPFSFVYKKNSIYLNELISTESNTLTSFSLNILQNMLTNIVTIIYSLYFSYKLIGVFGLITLILLPIYYFIYHKLRHKLHSKNKILNDIHNRYYTFMNELIASSKFIKINSLSDFLFKKSNTKHQELIKESLSYQKLNWMYQSSETFLSSLLNVFVMLVLGSMILKGNLTIGDYTIILSYFTMTISSARYFFNFGQTYQEIMASHDRLDNILRLKSENNGQYRLPYIKSIHLTNMSFNYSDNILFKNFNYTFLKDNCYIITGTNGRGKSTLIDIIIGLHFEQTKSNLKYNNIEATSIDFKHLRKIHLSFAEQDPYLIEDSILNNILLDTNNYNYSKLNFLIKHFNLETTLNKLPQGLNTILYQNVINLSGGEKKKISLIRTFLKDSDLIILDEPTNDLDNNTKEKLIQYIQKYNKNKIIIIITHDKDLLKLNCKIINL